MTKTVNHIVSWVDCIVTPLTTTKELCEEQSWVLPEEQLFIGWQDLKNDLWPHHCGSDCHTCLLSVMALGWHLVQMPSGQGGWPSQPDLTLQLMFSRAANFPLRRKTQHFRKIKIKKKKKKKMNLNKKKTEAATHLSAPPVSLRRYAWNDMCLTGGSRWFR